MDLCLSLFDEQKGFVPIYVSAPLTVEELRYIALRTTTVGEGLPPSFGRYKLKALIPLTGIGKVGLYYLFQCNSTTFRAGKVTCALTFFTDIEHDASLLRAASRLFKELAHLARVLEEPLQRCCSHTGDAS